MVLRYGYDLSYEQIASALGSSPMRPGRPRRPAYDAFEGGSPRDRLTDLDRRFRDAAVTLDLVDVGFDVVDSPIGPLFVAASGQGLATISFAKRPR